MCLIFFIKPFTLQSMETSLVNGHLNCYWSLNTYEKMGQSTFQLSILQYKMVAKGVVGLFDVF